MQIIRRALSLLAALSLVLAPVAAPAQIAGPRGAAVLSAKSFPGAYNVTPQWVARVRQSRLLNILMPGDSTTAGYGAGEGGTAWVNSFNHSLPWAVGQQLANRGYVVRTDGWFGDGQGVSGLIADFQARNTSNVVGASWTILTSPAETVGGALVRDNSGTSTMSLTCSACDRFVVNYRRATGSGSFQIDSETALTYDMATVTNFTLTSGIQQLVMTSGGGVGTHTLKISRISGDVQIAGVEPQRSAGGEIRILNMGRTGGTAGLAANSATNTSPLPALKTQVQLHGTLTAPLVIIDLGINDENTGISTTDFETAMQAVITQVVAGGGIPMLVLHHPTASGTPGGAYRAAMLRLAAANGIPMLDLTYYWPSWTAIVALGLNYDTSSHLIGAGYSAEAVPVAGFLLWVIG